MEYIYLHGFLSGPSSKKGEFLAGRFQEHKIKLHRPNLNKGNFENLTLTSQLEAVKKLLETINDKVILFGSSLGGYLATLAAENHKQIQRLVLMAPAFEFVKRYKSQLTDSQLNDWRENGYIELYHYHYEATRRLHYGIIEDALKYEKVELNRQLPVQIFHGLNDDSVPFQLSVDYLRDHPMADLVLFNSDHSLLDKLNEMWDYISVFIRL